MAVIDQASFDGEIADGESQTLTVSTGREEAGSVVLLADDGNQDVQPPSYDLTIRATVAEFDTSMFVMSDSGLTNREVGLPAIGQEMQVVVTNASGGDDDYRLTALVISVSLNDLVFEASPQISLSGPIRIEGDDDEGVTHEAQLEALNELLDSGSFGLVTYSAGALSSIGTDTIDTQAESHTAFFTDIEVPAGDISGGVTASPSANRKHTLYLNVAGAIDITVELSPDQSNFYEIDESPINLTGSGDKVILLNYEFFDIRLTGSNSTNVLAQMQQVM